MSDISIKDYKIYNLQKEYNRFSKFLLNFQDHIEKNYREHIISINDRNSFFKILNDLLRQMNTMYNTNMVNICGNCSESDDLSDTDSKGEKKSILLDIFPLANLTNINSSNMYEELRNLVKLCKILNIESINIKDKNVYNSIFNEPFDEIKDSLLNKIASKIGFSSLYDGLSLLLGEQFDKLFEKETINKLKFYNNIFVPINYSIKKINDNIEKEKIIFVKKFDLEKDVILENSCNLYINRINNENEYLVFGGYFQYDSLNIVVRTSQICNNFIYNKKKEIESYLNQININQKFLRGYIRNSTLVDFITMDKEEFKEQIEEDYSVYKRLIKLSFMNLMKEFVKEDSDNRLSIKHMYKIIKLLLLGSEENVNIAGLLYGIAKEKKPGTNFSISDIIYKNLSYISQIKLRKTNINIKNELEKIKTLTIDDVDLKKQVIVCKYMPDIVKKYCLEKVEELKSSNNEYYKQLLYVKTLLNFPWPSNDDDTVFLDLNKDKEKSKNFLEDVVKKLDEKVYGHKECKESIKELIGQWITNPLSSGTSIGLSGPPGVGKTLIAKAIGDALGIPFVQITLGGQNDGELLHGHGYTYSGAQPGMVVKKIVEAGSSRCIVYFDELDKACKKHDSNEIFNILIHMIDPNTNTEFQDRFFQDINFPLNKILFIFSYNDSSQIDPILMDRIKEIEVKPFKLQDKMIITNQFLIKDMCQQLNFNEGSVRINDNVIEIIIDKYTYEPGVRDLKRKIEKIFLKLNIDRIYKTNLFEEIESPTKDNCIILTEDIIKEYLGKQSAHVQNIHEEDQVGVINGLYATDAGKGGVLPIQVYENYTTADDKFTLKLTGSQRKVMRESVVSAFTATIHIINENIRNEYLVKNKYGFHIHTPSGAVPKDGPSAGCAFAIAFASRILNKKIRHDVAMTGEIELTGKVTKIGGLQYKLTGAKKAGVKLVLVSKENKEDIENIRKEYKDIFEGDFEVKLIDNIKEVLEYALVDFNKNDIEAES